MNLNSTHHGRLNVEIILITVLHKNMKARKRQNQMTSSDVSCHDA